MKAIRWWPAVLIAALAAAVLVWVWGFGGEQRQDRVVSTVVVSFFAITLLLLWALLFSRLGWRARLLVLAAAAFVVSFAGTTLRIRGFSGDVVPIVVWRWDAGSAVTEQALTTVAPPPVGEGPVLAATPEDYPQFLGPSRDARLVGRYLAHDWSSRPPRLLWRRPIGEGWSAFAVVGDYAITQEQRGETELVSCYRAGSGEPLWAHAERARFENPLAGVGPRATPTVHEGVVYALGATGILNALDLRTGRRLWRRDIVADAVSTVPTYGFAGSPLIVDDLVVVEAGGTDGSSLVAYDRLTGEPAWSGGDDPAAYSSPALAVLGGLRRILIFTDRHLLAHDPADGRVLWKTPWPAETEKTSQPVVLPGDAVFLSSGYGVGGKLFRVNGTGVDLVWESSGLKAKFTNVVHHQGYLYGLDDGILVCLDPEDGSRRWKRGRYGHGQLLLVDDLLLVQAEDGSIALVEATPEEHSELGRFRALRGKTWNHPALAGSRLFVRNDREASVWELPRQGG